MNLFGTRSSAPQAGPGTANGTNTGTGTGPSTGTGPNNGTAVDAGTTPVDTRLGRLAAVVERARRKGGGPNLRRWLELIGMAIVVFGFVCILLGWYGAAHSAYQYQETPYLISGGLLGVALVIAGGILLHTAWSMRRLEEDRRNALAIVRSVDRLERVLKTLDEKRRAEEGERERAL